MYLLNKNHYKRGFSLIELLVIIILLVLIASVILVGFKKSIDKTRNAKATADLNAISTDIILLVSDTGLWPNGCRAGSLLIIGEGATNEVALNTPAGGLTARPPVGVTDASGGCAWTDKAVNNWNGPYTAVTLDPWGEPYWFDNDYHARRDCPNPGSNPSAPVIRAIVSLGPNKTGGPVTQKYDCDDIYLRIY